MFISDKTILIFIELRRKESPRDIIKRVNRKIGCNQLSSFVVNLRTASDETNIVIYSISR